ncbi:MAG: biopolymer transporter ExbB [Halobacteriovorax sp.]|nr:biopolymer transporter ExbB [Halobacteriovorax sp.]|tara:strand:+ start:1063 stop:1584 length:522 start_codon:yes stop_codon:yes gene_type:complete
MIFDSFEIISDFLASGGDVLRVIFATTLLLWVFILERVLFYKFQLGELLKERENTWNQRQDKGSWFAHKVRECELSMIGQELNQNIFFIKTLVAVCPLLGLLGTVTGMIAVFDVMALTGTGNARSMASGISMATIPTMAGMVAALSGLYFGNLFENKAKKFQAVAEEKLVLEI